MAGCKSLNIFKEDDRRKTLFVTAERNSVKVLVSGAKQNIPNDVDKARVS